MPNVAVAANMDNLVRRYKAGESLGNLSKEVGVSDKYLRKRLVDAGARIRPRKEAARLAVEKAIDMDAVIARYKAGESPTNIGESVGLSRQAVIARLRAAGVRTRDRTDAARRRRVTIPNLPALAARYEAGEPLYQLAAEAGVSRGVLQRRFEANGFQLRTYAEAQRTKWIRILDADPDAGRKVAAAAHAAKRGSEMRFASKLKAAHTRHKRLLHRGAYEDDLAHTLSGAGFDVRQQFPIGPYNIDVALHCRRIAVEVLGRPLPQSASERFAERTKHILDSGWRMVFVLFSWSESRNRVSAVTQQLISIAQDASGDESVPSKYWVVRGNGKLIPVAGMDLDDLAVVLGPKSAKE